MVLPLILLGLKRWCGQLAWGPRTLAAAGRPKAGRRNCPPASAPNPGGGGAQPQRGGVKRGTKQGEERRGRRGPLVTRPPLSRKGLFSTPISTDTWARAVQSRRQNPSDTGGRTFPASVSPLRAAAYLTPSCVVGRGPQRSRGTAPSLAGRGRSCEASARRSPPAGFLRGQPGSLSGAASRPGSYLCRSSILRRGRG